MLLVAVHHTIIELTWADRVRQEITLWRQGERARRPVKSADQLSGQEPPTPVTICNIHQQLIDGNIQQRPNTLPTVRRC